VHEPFDFPKDESTGKAYLARLFTSDFLEMFSHTKWWVVPTVWVPVALLGLCREAVLNGTPFATLAALTVGGVVLWWCIEYGLHRCVFHMDDNLPDHPIARTTHFLLHGIHHKVPMDRFRLVMPPLLLLALATAMYPLIRMCCLFMPTDQFHFLFGVAMLGYVAYDVFHYSFHFLNVDSLPDAFAYNLVFLKKHHMKHHYNGNPNVGYGITTVQLDRVFGTELPVVMPERFRTKAL